MSGAEVLAVVGIIANVIALVDFGLEIYDRATAFSDEASNIPKVFRSTAEVLPLVKATLQQTERRLQEGDVDAESCQALTKVLESCLGALAELNSIFQNVLPKQDASKWTRVRKAISSVNQDKKVEVLENTLRRYIDVLTLYFSSQNPTITGISQAITSSLERERLERDKIQTKPLFLVRYPKEKDFIGREHVMCEISQRFDRRIPRVAICGIGGVGKSRIAIEYCYQYKDRHPTSHVFWVYGGSRSRLVEAYHEIAKELRIPGMGQSDTDALTVVSDWLSDESNGTFLMILDNADDTEIWEKSGDSSEKPLISYLPRGDHGSVLITTRNSQLGKTISKRKSVEVTTLSPRDSVALLQSKICEDDEVTEADSNEIAELLGFLPLAITQAAAYLSQIETSVAEYLELLKLSEADAADLLVRGGYDDSRDPDIPNAVFHTWKVSFEQISRQSPRAGAILSTMALLDRQAVPLGLLREEEEDELDIREAVQKLKSFSLITEQVKNQVFGMHRIVQLSIQWYLESERRLESWRERALDCVVSYLPASHDKIEMFEHYNVYLPHVYLVLNYKFTSRKCQLHLIELVRFLSDYHYELSNFSAAIKHSRQAVELQKSVLGEENEETVRGMLDLGFALSSDGDQVEADQLFDRALALSEHMSVDTKITVYTRYAQNLINYDKLEESDELYRQALKITTDHYGHESLEAAHTMIDISVQYRFNQRYEEAGKLQRQAIAISKAQKGDPDENRWTLHKYMSYLAETLYQAGTYAEALELEENILSFYQECLGSTARKTLASMARVLNGLRKTRQMEKADGYGRDILRLASDNLDHNDPLFCQLRETVAKCFMDLQLYDDAKLLWQTNIEISETDVFNATPWRSFLYKQGLVKLTIEMGRYEEAHNLLRELLKEGIAEVPRAQSLLLLSLSDLAREMTDNGQMKGVETVYRETLALAMGSFGADHHEVFDALSALANHLQTQGEFEEAESFYRESIKIGKVLVLSHSEYPSKTSYMHVVSKFRDLLEEDGRGLEAKALFEETVAVIDDVLSSERTPTPIPSKILDDAHASTLCDMEALARMLLELGETEKAHSLYMETIQLRKLAVPDSTEKKLRNMKSIKAAYIAMGKKEEQQTILRDLIIFLTEILGRHHEETLQEIHTLAISYRQTETKEAEALLREVLHERLKILGPHHRHTIDCKSDLAENCIMLGKVEEAELLLREVIDERTAVLGAHNSSTTMAMLDLANLLQDEEKPDEAEKLYMELVKIKKETAGPAHYSTLRMIYDLGCFYYDLGRFEDAAKLHREVLSVDMEQMGMNDLRTMLAMKAVGRDLNKLQQYEEAENLLRHALSICEDVLEGESVETIDCMLALGEMLWDSDRLSEEIEILTKALQLGLTVLGSEHETISMIQELLNKRGSDLATTSTPQARLESGGVDEAEKADATRTRLRDDNGDVQLVLRCPKRAKEDL